jgi:hypothetical protein
VDGQVHRNIAVLQIGVSEYHPCVRIDVGRPRPGEPLISAAYMRAESAGLIVFGLRRSDSLGGQTHFLELNTDTPAPLMSGAAVLNIRTGGVCAVLEDSWDSKRPNRALAVPCHAMDFDLDDLDLLAINQEFHNRQGGTRSVVQVPTVAGDESPEPAPWVLDEFMDPDSIATIQDFARALGTLRYRSGITIAALARETKIDSTKVNSILGARLLPEPAVLYDMLPVLGVASYSQQDQWQKALTRVRVNENSQRLDSGLDALKAAINQESDQADLLLRVYIPSERLYAAEASRLLSLFREWLTTTRGHGVRQSGYRTASGEMFEFFADASVVQADLRAEFDSFSNFLTLCSEDAPEAADMVASMGLDRASSAKLVARFGKEVQRLQIDLRHEREQRMLTIRHSLEEQLLESGVDLREIPRGQITALVESYVPGPSAPESLTLLAVPWTAQPIAPVTVINNPQIISAMQSTIIQNVRGIVDLGAQAKDVLAFIERSAGQDTPVLESAVYELEDPAAPPAAKSAAVGRLKKFLGQVSGVVRDVGVELLSDYLKSKGL